MKGHEGGTKPRGTTWGDSGIGADPKHAQRGPRGLWRIWPPAPPSLLPRCTGELSWAGRAGADLCLRMSPASSSPVLQECTGQENWSPEQEQAPAQPGRWAAGPVCCFLPTSSGLSLLPRGLGLFFSALAPLPHSGSTPQAHQDLLPGPRPAAPRPPPQLLLAQGRGLKEGRQWGGGQLTVEAAHIQSHAGLLLCCCPLELGGREGAGSPGALLLGPAHGLHEAMLTHGLEAVPPIIRHKPGRWELGPG